MWKNTPTHQSRDMVFEERGKKRAYIIISSSEDDDDDDDEEEDDPSDDETEEEFNENEDEYEEVEDEASDSTSRNDNDDEADGSRTSDDEADESDDEKSADHSRDDELLSNGVVRYLLEHRDLEELNLEECKSYLRQHGLRITGTKAECIQRIKEHWRIRNGNAETLYPRSSFGINCTGDVCKGDVVLFRQRVNKKSDKVTRTGSFLGTRTVAGRVVKESYGAARQQHTFTIEVLWSKGYKKIPPLFPLLVKGRNLYRMKTFRQHWKNEAERSIILAEKHKRGAAARSVRAMKNTNRACSINRSTERRKEKSAKRQKHSSTAGPSHTRKTAGPRAARYGKARGKAPEEEYTKSNNPRQKAPPVGRANSERNQNPTHPSRNGGDLETWSRPPSRHGGDLETWPRPPSQCLHQPQMQFHSHRPIVPDRFLCNESGSNPSATRFHPLRPYGHPHGLPVSQHHQGASHQPYPRPAYFHRPSYVYSELGSFNQPRESNLSRPFHFPETYGPRNHGF